MNNRTDSLSRKSTSWTPSKHMLGYVLLLRLRSPSFDQMSPRWRGECSRKKRGELAYVQHGWWPSFALLPRRTVGMQWIWLKPVYKRIVWRYTGLTDEPFVEFGTLIDVLRGDGDA